MKLLSFIFALAYLVIGSNVTINLHYCCDELVEVGFFGDAECGHQSSHEDGCSKIPCCADESLTFIAVDHVSPSANTLEMADEPFVIEGDLRSDGGEMGESQTIRTRAGPLIYSDDSELYLLFSRLVNYG